MIRSSTTFLKIVIVLMGVDVLAICGTVLPIIAIDLADGPALAKWVVYPILAGICISVLPFILALYQGWKLLTFIDQNIAFSELSVSALKKIKQYAWMISGIYVALMPLFYIFAEKDDAPGVILIGMLFIFSPFVIAVFASVLQKLLKNAIDLKQENDLTV